MAAFPYASCGRVPAYLAGLILVVCVHALRAAPGGIAGQIVDPHGNPVSNARVSLLNNDRELVRETISDQDGHFIFGGVTPGSYYVRAKVSSFAPVEVGLKVTDGQTTEAKL
jgi:hypothetical protein